jgi:hypothetical protein
VDLISTRVKAAGFIAGLLLLLGVGYWKLASDHEEEPVKSIVADLRRRSMPVDATLLDDSQPKLERFTVRAHWHFELNQDWDEYSRWLVERFRDFKIKDSGDGKIYMSKQLPGDTLRLTIERLERTPLRVRVSFSGFPS